MGERVETNQTLALRKENRGNTDPTAEIHFEMVNASEDDDKPRIVTEGRRTKNRLGTSLLEPPGQVFKIDFGWFFSIY
jgi:hypothetical protein